VSDENPGDVPLGVVDPIAQYDHDDGLAVIGGFRYRGFKIPLLYGVYVFGDFSRTFSNDGRLFYLAAGGTVREFNIEGQPNIGRLLLGFAGDAWGEIYVLGNSTGTPFGGTGVVLKLVPPSGAAAAPGGEIAPSRCG